MSNSTWSTLTVVLAMACSSAPPDPAAPAPETVTRVYAPGSGGLAMHNEPGFGSQFIPAPVDAVWRVLPRVYQTLEIPDVREDADLMALGNTEFRARRVEGKRISQFVDCGTGATAVPNADSYDVTLSVVTRISASDGGTLATTTVQANGRPRAVTGNPIHCQSKGTLEARVAELILLSLVGG